MPVAARRPTRRVAGVTVPLFSLRTARSWGIGEIGDLPDFGAWIKDAGLSLVQLLPLGEISGAETSPYSALSAFGIDPMYLSLGALPELSGGEPGPPGLLARARASARVDYAAVRALKPPALRLAFERFAAAEGGGGTSRGRALAEFTADHAAWLHDYALFRAIKDAQGGKAWWGWPAPLANRDPSALNEAGARLATDVRFHAWAQWLAHAQWQEARGRLAAMGVELMGDLPFMVARDSADVWANQGEFDNDRSVGAPPDAFDAYGQDWDLPPYRWDVMRANDFAWLRRRCRYTGSLYDRFRIDHLIGFYRTYSRPAKGRLDARGKLIPGSFDPAGEGAQLAHGERVVAALRDAALEAGSRLVAEDLGVIPDAVRLSLAHLGVPGYKVLIWEKDGAVFRSPRAYPALSLACFGTHDTDPVRAWWDGLPLPERRALAALDDFALEGDLAQPFGAPVHRALLDLIGHAGSELVLLLMQDVLGEADRINKPATTGTLNWSYRLPAALEALRESPAAAELLARVRSSMARGGRT